MVITHEKLAKNIEYFNQSWEFTNFAPKLYQICRFLATTKKLSINVESAFSDFFSQNTSANAKLIREIVMETYGH